MLKFFFPTFFFFGGSFFRSFFLPKKIRLRAAFSLELFSLELFYQGLFFLVPFLVNGEKKFTSSEGLKPSLSLAVASNFKVPMEILKKKFEAKTGIPLKISYGATRLLSHQIENDAPFDLFLAADDQVIGLLIKSKKAVAGTNFIYAKGRLALAGKKEDASFFAESQPKNKALKWNAKLDLEKVKNWVAQKHFSWAVLADPKFAPYGKAAVEVISFLNIEKFLNGKMIFAQNIQQAYQILSSENADFGFLALSLLKAKENALPYLIIPEIWHSPILQEAVMLSACKKKPGCDQFFQFLKQKETKDFLFDSGYSLSSLDFPSRDDFSKKSELAEKRWRLDKLRSRNGKKRKWDKKMG